jgi:ABC-2 type transport system ATP-binding protein
MSVAEPVVVASDLTKRFDGTVALAHLDLSVEPGTIYGFIGPSGSGKTTAVRLMTGILPPSSGQVRVFGSPPSAFGVRERGRIGYMPQLSGLYPHLSIWENLSFVASIYGLPWRRRRRRLLEALEFVELRADRRKLLREASGGMQRRVALAATLLHRPSLLFLDEPTAGIDPVLRRRLSRNPARYGWE